MIYHCDVSSVGQSPVESVNVFKKQNPENSAEYYVAPKTTKVLCSFEVTLIFTFQTQKKKKKRIRPGPWSGDRSLDSVCLQHSEPAVTCSCFVGSETEYYSSEYVNMFRFCAVSHFVAWRRVPSKTTSRGLFAERSVERGERSRGLVYIKECPLRREGSTEGVKHPEQVE